MIGRKAVIGLSLLSMLVFCAVAAPSAFATKGTTGFTCVKQAKPPFTGDWKDAHCTEKDEKKESEYEHAEIKPGTETAITVSNKNTKNKTTESTDAVLNATVNGNKSVVTCKKVHGTGTQTNNAGPPMNVSGTITVEFSECTATLGGKACENVNGGLAIVTKAITSTPTEKMEVTYVEDEEAGKKIPFAKFTIKCAGVTFGVEVLGFATSIPNGATQEFTKESTEGRENAKKEKEFLYANGQIASFTSITTVTMSTTEPGIALTTTAS